MKKFLKTTILSLFALNKPIYLGIFVTIMTEEIFIKLCSDELLSLIEENIERTPNSIALDKRLHESALVATQVKYLQRARTKLPSYYSARCIMPPLSYEQSSSEVVANEKSIEGESVLDLTCGLGVDAFTLSKRFTRVVTLERSEMLARIARENFKRLGVSNIEVINLSAEEYLADCTEHFDWIYADPDRRSSSGQKLVRLEDCSPNMLALMSDIKRVADGQFMIKNSPLFDVDEALRLFSPARVEVLSVGDECKEVVVSAAERCEIAATAIGRGKISVPLEDITTPPLPKFEAESYRYLITPDVALLKSRLARYALSGVADIWSNNGFALAREMPTDVIGRVEEIEKIVDYNPKSLRKELKGVGIEILKRDFPYSTKQIVKELKIKEGGARRIAFTHIESRLIVIFLK